MKKQEIIYTIEEISKRLSKIRMKCAKDSQTVKNVIFIVNKSTAGNLLPEGDPKMSIRSSLYTIARLMGDANAVKKNKVGKRIERRIAEKITGRMLGKLFR